MWSPTGKARGTLLHAPVGRHPGQTPCLHAEVPAFAETLRAGRRYGTQAWPSAAGVKQTLIPNYRCLTPICFAKCMYASLTPIFPGGLEGPIPSVLSKVKDKDLKPKAPAMGVKLHIAFSVPSLSST